MVTREQYRRRWILIAVILNVAAIGWSVACAVMQWYPLWRALVAIGISTAVLIWLFRRN